MLFFCAAVIIILFRDEEVKAKRSPPVSSDFYTLSQALYVIKQLHRAPSMLTTQEASKHDGCMQVIAFKVDKIIIIICRPPAKMLVATLAAIFFFLSSQTKSIDAFITSRIPTTHCRDCAITRLHLARKYIVIGGNIDGINPNKDEEEEDTYNMSKKERRRRERERGAAAFKSGAYKQKKKKMTMKEKLKHVDFDKLEEQVTKQRSLFPREMRNNNNSVTNNKPTKKLSPKAARLQKQRTAGGNIISSTTSSMDQSPEKQTIQIRIAKRGNKTVTMIQGMTLPFKERKVLLKEMKTMLGGGGALVENVLELQGSHSDKIVEYLKSKGFSNVKKAG